MRVDRLLVCGEWPHWPLPPRLLALRNAGSARPIAQAMAACTAEAGSGTDAETTQEPGIVFDDVPLKAESGVRGV